MFCPFRTSAVTPDTSSVQKGGEELTIEEQLAEGINDFYMTDWSSAKKVFSSIKSRAPEDPRAYFFEAMMPFLEYFFIEQSAELAEDFLEKSEIAITYSSEKLDASPNDTTMVLLLSGLHGYRGLVAADQNNHRVALSSGLTGFNFTRKLLSMDTERADARIGRGMFYYMVGSIPSGMRWAANIVGLKADVEDGFNELKIAAESDNYISNDALMMLMYLYHKENNLDQAIIYAEKLTDELPENIIFLYKKAEIYEDNGDINKAINTYSNIIEMDNSDVRGVTVKSKERLGNLEKNALFGSK